MDKTILGQTTLEQMPAGYKTGEHRHARKPWVFIILGIVVILFGLFWLYEKHEENNKYPVPPTTPPADRVSQKASPLATDLSPTTSAADISDLQASVISTPVTDFSSVF